MLIHIHLTESAPCNKIFVLERDCFLVELLKRSLKFILLGEAVKIVDAHIGILSTSIFFSLWFCSCLLNQTREGIFRECSKNVYRLDNWKVERLCDTGTKHMMLLDFFNILSLIAYGYVSKIWKIFTNPSPPRWKRHDVNFLCSRVIAFLSNFWRALWSLFGEVVKIVDAHISILSTSIFFSLWFCLCLFD